MGESDRVPHNECPVFTHQMHHTDRESLHASLSSTTTILFLPLSHCVTQTSAISSPASISTYQRKPAHENMLFAAVATCTDSQPLTTYTPSVMFYKHFLNNSAHPHLANGLFFPEGAWLLFASSRLSFCSCLSLFRSLLPPSSSLLYICCGLLCVIDALCTLRIAFTLALFF